MAFKKYNDPEEMKSKYVHERRDNQEELRKREAGMDNRNNMGTNNMDQLSKFWDNLVDRIMNRRT